MGVPLSSRYHSMSTISSFISCVLMLQGKYTVSPIRASIENSGTVINGIKKINLISFSFFVTFSVWLLEFTSFFSHAGRTFIFMDFKSFL